MPWREGAFPEQFGGYAKLNGRFVIAINLPYEKAKKNKNNDANVSMKATVDSLMRML